MKCEHEIFTQEAGIVCSKTLEIIQLKKELKENSSYRSGELEQQLKEANEVIFNINNKSVGKEYGLDAEELWELSKGYIEKYKVEE